MKYRGFIIFAVICALLLGVAFFSGGEPAALVMHTPEPLPTANADIISALGETSPTPERAEQKPYCTLSVRCDTILLNMDRLDSAKTGIIPADGIVFPKQRVELMPGDSVFSVLEREMKRCGIHLEFVNTPAYNSSYIEGIANIYEFDCGDLSGWMFKVNGDFPGRGCSECTLSDGDEVEWIYTCDMGRDIGK